MLGQPHAGVAVVAVGGTGDRRDAVEEQGQTRRHQRHAEEVERLRRLGRVLLEDDPGVDHGRDAERQVDQEDPVPAGVLDQPAADDRAEDRAEQHRDAEDRHQAAHPVRAGRPGHDRHAERHQHAAAEALEHPEGDQHLDRGRRGAERGAEREQADRGEVEALGAEPVGGPAGQRDDRREREGVARDRPRHRGVGQRVVDAGEDGLERRQGDVDDGDVEDRHDRAEHDHAGDLEDRAVDVVGVLGSRGCGSLSHPARLGTTPDTRAIGFTQGAIACDGPHPCRRRRLPSAA